jgi:hypothetical protein
LCIVQTNKICIFEVVSYSVDIVNYLSSMWHVCSNKFQFAKLFYYSCFGSCLWDTLLVGFSYNVEFYIKLGKPFASSYPNHCFAWLFNHLSLSRISSLAWYLILILVICFFVVKMILDLCVKYHREINNSKYLLSLDNWYFIMGYIYIDHLFIGYCF